MERRKASRGRTRSVPAFNAQAFLDSSGTAKTIVEYGRGETIFTEGDACEDVLSAKKRWFGMLSRNIRIEEDLIEQLFNSSEKRLARTLLLLAGYGKQDKPARVVPKISQETLAETVGTTRSRVNFFLNKFKRLASPSGTGLVREE